MALINTSAGFKKPAHGKMSTQMLIILVVVGLAGAFILIKSKSMEQAIPGLLIGLPLLAGAVYVVVFVFRILFGERMKDHPAAPQEQQPTSNTKAADSNSSFAGALTAVAIVGALVWFFVFRTSVGTPEFYVTASEISKEFSDNEVAAFAKYEGKVVQVTGVYKTSGISIGAPWVLLDPGVAISGYSGVQCFFPRGNAEEAARLKKGASVTLKGVVIGKTGFVGLTKCTSAR